MASRIHILPDGLMKRIAAGEVVERPASVAKELIENSLDAGATSITVAVQNAGVDLVQVIDNGEGMSEEDALICCERHATSKISRDEDLEAITTLGFRGEALASIASVSRMRMITMQAGVEEATEVELYGGEIREVLKTAANPGTSIAVKDLFFNVPARRKFLKSPATELRHLILVFRRLAMAYPEIDFRLHVNDEKTQDLRPSGQEERIGSLVAGRRNGSLISFENASGPAVLKGYISRPGEGRRSRDDQFVFLNRRFILNKSITHAVLSAYGSRLPRDEYPVYVLFLEMDPRQFDVNVHPMKIEVRFRDERFLHNMIHRAVGDALSSSRVVPNLQLVTGGGRPHRHKGKMTVDPVDYGQLTLEVQRPVSSGGSESPGRGISGAAAFWQLHNRYILTPIKSGLIIIDQHVAHERILFERVLNARERNGVLSQQLLFPQTVLLSPDDFHTLMEMLPSLQKIGFGIKDFGKFTVVIESVPAEIKTGNERDLLLDIIDEYKNLRHKITDIWEAVASAFACKAAIKSGDPLNLMEMASLMDQLFATREPYFCPHGRPIIINLPLEELDKRFGR